MRSHAGSLVLLAYWDWELGYGLKASENCNLQSRNLKEIGMAQSRNLKEIGSLVIYQEYSWVVHSLAHHLSICFSFLVNVFYLLM
jgi:hypothetical protein